MILLEEIEKVVFPLRFTAAHLKKIAKAAQLKECPADEVIFQEGEHKPIHLLRPVRGGGAGDSGGRLRNRAGAHTRPGGAARLVAAARGAPMTATARAMTRCRLAALDAAQLQALAEEDPRFGMEFFRGTSAALAQRLHAVARGDSARRSRQEPHPV